MKKRISRIMNFLAFNLLFFALYLNFIHKDNSNQLKESNASSSVKGTVLVKNPGQYITKPQGMQRAAVTATIN